MVKDDQIYITHILESIKLIEQYTKKVRIFLIHEYFDVDEKEVWYTVKNDLPELKKKLKLIN